MLNYKCEGPEKIKAFRRSLHRVFFSPKTSWRPFEKLAWVIFFLLELVKCFLGQGFAHSKCIVKILWMTFDILAHRKRRHLYFLILQICYITFLPCIQCLQKFHISVLQIQTNVFVCIYHFKQVPGEATYRCCK